MKSNPLWILERVQIERREVRAFLWKEKLQIEPEPVDAFRRHLSELESYMVGSQTRIGVTPRQWINTIDFGRYAPSKQLAPTALRQLQTLSGWGGRNHDKFPFRLMPGLRERDSKWLVQNPLFNQENCGSDFVLRYEGSGEKCILQPPWRAAKAARQILPDETSGKHREIFATF